MNINELSTNSAVPLVSDPFKLNRNGESWAERTGSENTIVKLLLVSYSSSIGAGEVNEITGEILSPKSNFSKKANVCVWLETFDTQEKSKTEIIVIIILFSTFIFQIHIKPSLHLHPFQDYRLSLFILLLKIGMYKTPRKLYRLNYSPEKFLGCIEKKHFLVPLERE